MHTVTEFTSKKHRMKGLHTFLCMSSLLWAHLINVAQSSLASSQKFDRDFQINWGPENVHISSDGNRATLVFDKKSGVGAVLVSNQQFLFGQFDMKIKLTPDKEGRSTGSAASYFLVTQSDNARIYYIFLPNENGKGYMLQSNIFINGNGNREENVNLWFDPTKDYHSYSIFWNTYQVVFKVDGRTVRKFKNNGELTHSMSLVASINKVEWVTTQSTDDAGETDNGDDPSKIPSSATYKDLKIDASVWMGNSADNYSIPSESKWWNYPEYSELKSQEMEDMKNVREKYLVYDYCQDHGKFGGNMPKECSLPKY